MAKAREDFLGNGAVTVGALRSLEKAVSQATTPAERNQRLEAFYRKVHFLSATAGLAEPLTTTMRNAYRQVANEHGSPDLILRMVDPELPLRRVKTPQSVSYLSPVSIEAWTAEKRTFAVESELPRGLELGNAIFDANRARELGLATVFYDSRGHQYIHQGPYTTAAELERDVRRYALGGASA